MIIIVVRRRYQESACFDITVQVFDGNGFYKINGALIISLTFLYQYSPIIYVDTEDSMNN